VRKLLFSPSESLLRDGGIGGVGALIFRVGWGPPEENERWWSQDAARWGGVAAVPGGGLASTVIMMPHNRGYDLGVGGFLAFDHRGGGE
jgi:hypothetical protein